MTEIVNRSSTPKPGTPQPTAPKPPTGPTRPPTRPSRPGKAAAHAAMARHPGGRTCAGAVPVAALLTVVAMVRNWREFGDLWRETATGGTW